MSLRNFLPDFFCGQLVQQLFAPGLVCSWTPLLLPVAVLPTVANLAVCRRSSDPGETAYAQQSGRHN